MSRAEVVQSAPSIKVDNVFDQESDDKHKQGHIIPLLGSPDEDHRRAKFLNNGK